MTKEKSAVEERLMQVTAPHLCAGIIMRAGVVIEAAPIFRWTIGKHYTYMVDYCRRKGWTMQEVSRQ